MQEKYININTLKVSEKYIKIPKTNVVQAIVSKILKELIIPDEVSTIRGGGLPSLGFKVIDLVTIAPKFSTLTNSGISVP